MAITSEAELKTKVQTIAGTKREYRKISTQASVAELLKTEVTDLEASGSSADLIKVTKKYLSRVESHYSQSINTLNS
jgi:hypothetical protein